MKKIMCGTAAAVVTCLSGTASAQVPPDRWSPATLSSTSVQLYGTVDTGVEYLSNANAAGGSLLRMPTLSGTLPSNIGFRGAEDLGGGLRALFNLESGFAVDSGTLQQGARQFGRAAWVGLQGTYGTLMFGRMTNMTYIAGLRSNVLGPSIHTATNLDSYLPNARSDNAIGYLGKFGEFTVGATYSLGRDASGVSAGPSATNCPGELANNSRACRQYTAMLSYDTKRFGVAASFDRLYGGTAATGGGLTNPDFKDERSGANGYFFIDSLKVGGGVVHRKTTTLTRVGSNLSYLGVSYPFAPRWTVDLQAARLDISNSPNDSTMVVARTMYAFSPRTSTYASLGHINNGGTAAISLSAGGSVGPGLDQNGLMIGLRHFF